MCHDTVNNRNHQVIAAGGRWGSLFRALISDLASQGTTCKDGGRVGQLEPAALLADAVGHWRDAHRDSLDGEPYWRTRNCGGRDLTWCVTCPALQTMLISSGRTMGFSGITKGIWTRSADWHWRGAFLGSLIAASGLARLAYPALHEPIAPENFIRIVIGGLAVGLGSGMANGCTSGHGIVGFSRFSLRSMVHPHPKPLSALEP